ncbi:hypothetical protein EKD16_13075 [Streptomonospora litoralis]|uniref:Uncharacterized protein n=1 Tax=Streptomonospora litoralis TaxID=2498135 RepID=A0A4P6Q6H2_9ACTN|nr:hypothetical protein EKD16_13075 [Streptomonospora litoralis]
MSEHETPADAAATVTGRGARRLQHTATAPAAHP